MRDELLSILLPRPQNACGFFEIEQSKKVLRELSIILVTAADPLARAGIEGKTVATLRKPIDIDEFLVLVERFYKSA